LFDIKQWVKGCIIGVGTAWARTSGAETQYHVSDQTTKFADLSIAVVYRVEKKAAGGLGQNGGGDHE
jgi:hypothetical protein